MYFQFALHPTTDQKFDVIYIGRETARAYFEKGFVIYVDTNGPEGHLLPPIAFCEEYAGGNIPSFAKSKGAKWDFEIISNWLDQKAEKPFKFLTLKNCKDTTPWNYVWVAEIDGKTYEVPQ